MAFSDLAPNQMVNENDASTGGFAVIGAKNQPNECYTKARALATYSLNASNMSGYADNQLVPKSAWSSSAIVFTPYSYNGTIRSVSTGPSFQFTFQITIDVYGAPAWNQIVAGSSTVTISQSTSGTNGVTNVQYVSGTLYQCNTVQGIVSNTVNASVTFCNIRVTDGTTQHTHTFAVPVTFTPTEIGNGVVKTVSVNVT
jgi:hypothetical protein